MRRFLVILTVALALLSVSGLFAQDEPVTTGIPLQIVDSSPFAGEELALDDTIVLYFDRPVDCDSARDAISITPAVAGSLECDDASLQFIPDAGFDRATTYTIQVKDTLHAQDGGTLLEPFTLELSTIGYLMVSDVLPADGSLDVEADSTITVVFNRPVVPLVIAEDMGNLPQPLTITPEVEGQGEWLNTSIYVFHPEPAFDGGTTYTVTVSGDLQATDGSVMQEPVPWSFSTINPAVLDVSYQRSMVPLDNEDPLIRIRFNMLMDRASVEQNFYLRPEGRTDGTLPGTFEWFEDGLGFSFTYDERLEIETTYNFGFNAGQVLAASGEAILEGEQRWNFTTVPLPAILGTSPEDGEQDVSPYGGGFTIYFASPMDTDTVVEHINIEPVPWRDPDFYGSDYDNTFSISFPVDPSEDYVVTLEPGMADPYGNTIDEGMVVRFTTGAYEPGFSLQVPGRVGFYNAYNDATQLFVTSYNVSQLDLELYSVPVQSMVQVIAGDNYYAIEDFDPPPSELLRDWQVTPDGTLNIRDYELLNLGGQEICPGAAVSRLQVGDTAIVISDPDPVRARSEPPDGEIVELLYRDYQLEVTGGPVCEDGLLWWQVELRSGETAWVAEGTPEEYFIDVRTEQRTPIPLSETLESGEALDPGVYFLSVDSPETRGLGFREQHHFLLVATANLIVKTSVDSVLVWATDVQTGAPIANAPITIYDVLYQVVASGTTDANGMMRLDTPRVESLNVDRIAVLETESQFGVGFSEWSNGIEPYQFGQNYTYYPEQFRIYMYTDRPIYRPDQPVYFRGVVRSRDDVTYTPPPFDTIPVQITDGRGEVVFDQQVEITPFGTFSGQFDIADDAPLGYYQIVARAPVESSNYYGESGYIGFSVAEYRAPEYQVIVTPEEDQVAQGDTVRVAVDSRYFFGGPVSTAQIQYSVVSEPYYFNYTGRGYFDFVDFNYDEGPGEYYGTYGGEVATGEATTDEQGMFVIEVPAELQDDTQSQIFRIEAVVTDESGQAVAGRTQVIVHKGLVYIGARPEGYVGEADEESIINIVAVDWNSEPVSVQNIDVEVVERRWSSVQEEDENGRTIWTWEVEEIPVTTGSVTTDVDGEANFAFVPPNGGIFKIIITTHDDAGNEIVSSTTMWVSSGEYVSWRQQNSNRIDLIADQEDYTVGDTAEILITSPFQGTTEALITVERGDVLSYEHVTMDSNSYVYQLPITPDFAPNIYVSVLLVKGVDETNPVAAFRMGLIGLGVDNEQKEITIEITPDREQAQPRETVTYTINTTNYAGEPVAAEVGVGLTDLSVLTIAPRNSPQILGFYYGQQGLAVLTATPLTINTDQLTQTTLDTIKGGGGGGGEGGIFDIRQDFIDTAFWNATVMTDENGVATVEVTMPDNLTTWRLDARAVTSGSDGLTLVGEMTFDLISTKPLLVRPVTPRFFVVGDQVNLAAVVNNNTGEEMSVDIFIEGTGFTFQGESHQTFVMPPNTRQRVEWPVIIEDVENIDLTFFANGGDGAYTDASKPPLGQGDNQLLPVYRYEVPETVGTAGILREAGSRTEGIVLPERFDVTQGELTINLDPSLAATTIDGLEYLRNYPHQCIEQTISRFLPNIMTFRALNQLGVANETLRTQLRFGVEFALQRLYAQQHTDGGWGWFVYDYSNGLTTAYALIGLTEARNEGFLVDPNVIARAQDYLRTTFIVPSLSVSEWELNRQAFILYALARSGAPDIARTSTLFESHEHMNYYARAFLALTFNLIDPADTSRSDVLLSDLNNAAIASATGMHWEEDYHDYWNWNSNTRTTAIVLDALVKLRPDSDIIPNVVRWLMVARTADAWETTQETAWAVMALTDWMILTGELHPDYDFTATFNGELLAEGTATTENVRDSTQLVVQVADMLADQANNLVIGRSEGNGVLYYTAHLRAFLPVPEVEALNRGIIIERRYTLQGDDTRTPITEAHVGDLVRVRLTIIAPNSLHYVVVEDPIPAGTDAVNPNLETSQQIGTRPGLDAGEPLRYGWGWWWFSNTEFRDEKVVLYSTYLPAGTYEYVYTIRAGLPGIYNVIPAVGQEFYFPEVYGRSDGSTFTILP
jgi:alpha-2-macroglobulin